MKNISAFETWKNGKTQVSAFHRGEEAERFIEDHKSSRTFATLHVYSIEEGERAYDSIVEQIEWEEKG